MDGYDPDFNLTEQAEQDLLRLPVMALLYLAQQAAERVITLGLAGVHPPLEAGLIKDFREIVEAFRKYAATRPELWDVREFTLNMEEHCKFAKLNTLGARIHAAVARYERAVSERTGFTGRELYPMELPNGVYVSDLKSILGDLASAVESVYEFFRFGEEPPFPSPHRVGVYNCCGEALWTDRKNRERTVATIYLLKRICRMPQHEFVPVTQLLNASSNANRV